MSVRPNGMGIFALLLAICFSLISIQGARAAAAPDSPLLVFGPDPEERTGGVLIGGFSKGAWWGLSDFPITVNGKPIPENQCAQNVHEEGKNLAVTPLLPEGVPLVFYTVDGAVVGTGVTTRNVRYDCYEANGQPLLSPELDSLSVKEADGSGSLTVGLREGTPVGFVPTKRTEERNKRLTFSTNFGGKEVSIVYVPMEKSGNDWGYTGELIVDGKSRPFAPALADETDEIDGYFIDLYKDGTLEFFSLTDGPAAGVGLYSLSAPDPTKSLMGLDMGE